MRRITQFVTAAAVLLLCLPPLVTGDEATEVATSTAAAQDGQTWEDPHVQWDESLGAFVPYPKEAYGFLALEEASNKPSVQVEILANIEALDHPIFTLLKGIIHRNHGRIEAVPRYFVQDGGGYGVSGHCREAHQVMVLWMYSRTVTTEIQTTNCTRHCTNHGRYCMFNHQQMGGANLVQEAARRMCFESVLEDAGSIELWKYLDAFQQQECPKYFDSYTYKEDSTRLLEECARHVMHHMLEIPDQEIQQCIAKAGGFEDDRQNKVLQSQLQYQEDLLGPDYDLDHDMDNLPLVVIDGETYKGHYTTKDLFHAVCSAYPANQAPLGCDICQGCKDVRKCLWHLECDGNTISPHVFEVASNVAKEEAEIPANATVTHSSSSSSNAMFGSRWDIGFIFGIVAGLVIAAFFAIREIRTRRLVKQLAKARDFNYEFKQQEIPDIASVLAQMDLQTTPSDLAIVYDHAENAKAQNAPLKGKAKDDIVYV